ncbi:hypothetical protein FA13DRAFT_1737695 [Coprinellus micaceus]|uniref:F-box domain-containing protein n=1 Tax=Coprinellus micaceus TaxID=71717 RepID=A0A4Y7SVZ4_COPMI|nr:hypothetical protein FA13DRAFT_1737695 [Coprinellus micaceus]
MPRQSSAGQCSDAGASTVPVRKSLAKSRRKSLKTFFQLPLSTRSSSIASLDGTTPCRVVDRLPPSDILSVSLTSTHLRQLLLPALYDTVVLKSSRSCRTALFMLKEKGYLCRYIKKLASGNLSLLNTFDWDGLELPTDMAMGISTNIGRNPLPLRSQLFSFSGLKSFSIIARHGIPSADSAVEVASEHLPEDFWDMILQRSPDLEELAICTFSPSARLFNFDRIVEGSWQFLKRHNSIKYLRFLWNFRHFMSPDTTRLTLPPNCLPALNTRLGSLTPILRGLRNLTSLEIWVHLFDSNRDHTAFFHSIISSCPKLTDLHFMCTNSFTSRPLKQLVSGLHLLPKLKRFSLTKGHKYLDESMLESAIRILKASPKVQQINVRWARERCPNHLKQEGNYDTGLPTSVVVLEKGIGLMGGPFCKKYKHAIKWAGPGEWQRSVVSTTKTVRRRVSRVLSVRQSMVYN